MTDAVPEASVLAAPPAWRTVDFVSDLHLGAGDDGTARTFARYLRETPADAVFILGDLFEAWIGDDAAEVPRSSEAAWLARLAECARERALFVMHGNRDFLLGPKFAAAAGARLLADPTRLDFAGHRLLLTHGDLLCTDDVAYQRYRPQVHEPAWQAAVLAKPLAERQALARHMRSESEAYQDGGAPYAPIDEALARRWLITSGATTLVHGHTHRPGHHALGTDAAGRALERIVLTDWHAGGGADDASRRAEALRLSADGFVRVRLPAG